MKEIENNQKLQMVTKPWLWFIGIIIIHLFTLLIPCYYVHFNVKGPIKVGEKCSASEALAKQVQIEHDAMHFSVCTVS